MTDDTYTPNDYNINKRIKQVTDIDVGPEGMPKEEFLDKFPKNVIKNGNIIPIREELEKKF